MKKQHMQFMDANKPENNWLLLGANCWRLASAALWPDNTFTSEEEEHIIKLLSSQIFQGANFYKTYLEICQRILLTREQLMKNPGYVISNNPCRFFNSTEKGFSLSAGWYLELVEQRKKSIVYKIQMRALAEAILEFSEDPSKENIVYWLKWFLENNAPEEWFLYTICASYFLIDNKNYYGKK